MRSAEDVIGAFLAKIGFPFLLLSALALHWFTVMTAYELVAPGWRRYVAAAATLAFPPVSEAVIAYYAWRASGSMVNAYSVWLLAWLLLFFVVLGLIMLQKRLGRY